jgi:hypothetical protein
VPRWWAHVSSNVLLEDDQIFLHLGEEELARRRAAGLAHSQVRVRTGAEPRRRACAKRVVFDTPTNSV